MSITTVPVRATVTVGGLVVSTPYVQSFTVSKTRGQISTCDLSLKVKFDELSTTGGITIEAGTKGNLKTIFKGVVKKATVSPCWDDPSYVIINISGMDVLYKLEGKKYTRRCRTHQSSWVAINSVVRPGLRSGKFQPDFDVIITNSDSVIQKQEKTKAPPPVNGSTMFNSENKLSCFVELDILGNISDVDGGVA